MARRRSKPLLRSPDDLRGLRVTVMGLGTKGGGVETVKYLVRQKAHVTVTDLKPAQELTTSMEELQELPVTFVLGVHREEDFIDTDLVIQNPAVPSSSPYLRRARDQGIPIETDVALFVFFCPAAIAGVTGTRGKTTTTIVAGTILREERPDTVIAGNVQRSPLADLERVTARTSIVLELSSWQLEGLAPHRFSPHWAVFTTLLPDHLNRYPSFAAYARAKETIFRYQTRDDVLILPTDDRRVAACATRAAGRVRWFGPWPSGTRTVPSPAKEFSTDVAPGLYRAGDVVVSVAEGRGHVLLPWRELTGRGDHTKRNMLAGALLAREMGASDTAVRKVLQTFAGVPHRLEPVRTLTGRQFVNDTTATTPEAVVAALQAFPYNRMVLITGGTDKALDMSPVAAVLDDPRVAHVVLLDGSATQKLLRLLPDSRRKGLPVVRTMDAAVQEAFERSLPGDVVLLSPGAASFELFRDEFHRGEEFRRAVAALPAESPPP